MPLIRLRCGATVPALTTMHTRHMPPGSTRPPLEAAA